MDTKGNHEVTNQTKQEPSARLYPSFLPAVLKTHDYVRSGSNGTPTYRVPVSGTGALALKQQEVK